MDQFFNVGWQTAAAAAVMGRVIAVDVIAVDVIAVGGGITLGRF
jgi:hypothetical protein